MRDLDVAAEAGADAIGLVRVAGSPRAVTRDEARQLAAATPPCLTPITLLVNPEEPDIHHGICPWTQLHGDEPPRLVELAAAGGPVVRAAAWNDLDAIRRWDASPHVARLLIDSPRGGSGEAFDHEAFLPIAVAIQTPWILAGGLTPDTVTAAIQTLRPWGVDVSSGIESSRGVKDPARIEAFCAAVRAADG
jgi:phosphoribosylanthranilate isomerase